LILLQTTVDYDVVYLISGYAAFIRKLSPWFKDVGFHRSIVVMERCSRGESRSSLRAFDEGGMGKVLMDFDLEIVPFVEVRAVVPQMLGMKSVLGNKISPLPLAEIGVSMCVRVRVELSIDLSEILAFGVNT
jgi:hypothetical protein